MSQDCFELKAAERRLHALALDDEEGNPEPAAPVPAKKNKKKKNKNKNKAAAAKSAVKSADDSDDEDFSSAVPAGAENEFINVQVIYSEHSAIKPYFARVPKYAKLLDATVEETVQSQTLIHLQQEKTLTPDEAKNPKLHFNIMANTSEVDIEDLGNMRVHEFVKTKGLFLVEMNSEGKDEAPPMFIDSHRQLREMTTKYNKLTKMYIDLTTKHTQMQADHAKSIELKDNKIRELEEAIERLKNSS